MRNFIFISIFYFIMSSAFSQVLPGAYQTDEYLPLLKDKTVGIVSNQSSLIGQTHLVDSLLNSDIDIIRAFAPEHGFRGKAEAGALLVDERDTKTGLEVVSLYGKNKKPSPEQLNGIDIMVFDLQGVGVRFYTYISTLTYVMEACAENNIKLIVLDRPNPNANYVDGPVLNMEHKSFVGMLPIPVVYGMTDGELALMINGEKWLKDSIQCDVEIIKIRNYNHDSVYELPIKPSPNLPNFQSIYLYPSLCFFEGTVVSIGRGTHIPFQQIGYPGYPDSNHYFTPKSIKGVSEHPKFENQKCTGLLFNKLYKTKEERPTQLDLPLLLHFHKTYPEKDKFFNAFFNKLAGNSELRTQVEEGWTESDIRDSWKQDLDLFKVKRQKYLLYQ